MSDYVFSVPVPSVAIEGSTQRFPVHRIYCVGRNYADHAKEMGTDPKTEPPVFFMKPADAVVEPDTAIPYAWGTSNLHHEIELVVAIGKTGGQIPQLKALEHVFGYAVGNDLTRRDLQNAAKKKGTPWDASKGFDHSAPIAAIRPASAGQVTAGRIWLSVNGEIRQDSDVSAMIWSVPEIIAQLSTLYVLQPGDLIFTGTPAGVGPIKPGDTIEGGIDGLPGLRHSIARPALGLFE